MFRTLLYYCLFIPWTIFVSVLTIVSPAGPVHAWVHRNWSRVGLWAAGAHLSVDTAGLDPSRSYIFMANHQSLFDIMVMCLAFKAWDPRFVAKESLFSLPFFGPAMKRAGHVAIDRDNMRKAMKSIEAAAEAVHGGRSLVVFPEGTRSKDFSTLHEFKIGGMILALKTGAPVVPVVIEGTGYLKAKHSLGIRPGRVTVRALPPIDPTAYSMKERERFRDDLFAIMNAAYLRLREEKGIRS